MNDVQDDAEGPEPPAEPEPAADEQARPEPARFRLRRAPRYRAFGLTGVVVGVVIGLIIAFSHPADSDYSENTVAGYFAAVFGLVGALIGLGAAVLADRRRSR